jgi:hypothetical protein
MEREETGLEWQKLFKRLTVYMEFYTGIMIAAPLFIIALVAIMGMIQPTIAGVDPLFLTQLGIYVFIPAVNVVFLTVLGKTEVVREIGRIKSLRDREVIKKWGFHKISLLISGYVIFFVFLGVIASLQRYLLPSLMAIWPVEGAGMEVTEVAQEYHNIFRNLILIQAFFGGLALGQLTENSLATGLKHGFLMAAAGLLFSLVGLALLA